MAERAIHDVRSCSTTTDGTKVTYSCTDIYQSAIAARSDNECKALCASHAELVQSNGSIFKSSYFSARGYYETTYSSSTGKSTSVYHDAPGYATPCTGVLFNYSAPVGSDNCFPIFSFKPMSAVNYNLGNFGYFGCEFPQPPAMPSPPPGESLHFISFSHSMAGHHKTSVGCCGSWW